MGAGAEIDMDDPVEEPVATVDPARFGRALVAVIVVLVLTTFLAQLLKWKHKSQSIVHLLDSDQKTNIPTGYKILALVASAIVVWTIARVARAQHDRWARQWLLLSAVLAYLAFDEIAFVHQTLNGVLEDRIGERSGVLHFPWVLVYLPAAAVVAALLWRFLWSLPARTRGWFIAGLVLFGGGSGGIELLKSVAASKAGEHSLVFFLAAAVSDSLEEIGLAVFLVAALRELARRTRGVRILLTET